MARDDYEAHDALIAIAEGSVVAADNRRRLTPDNFLDHIIPLIESAQDRLYIQNQYFWVQTARNPWN